MNLHIINTYNEFILFSQDKSNMSETDFVLTHSRIVFQECQKSGHTVQIVEFPARRFVYDGVIRSLVLYFRILKAVYNIRKKISTAVFYSHISNEHYFTVLFLLKLFNVKVLIIKSVSFDVRELNRVLSFRVFFRKIIAFGQVDFYEYNKTVVSVPSSKFYSQFETEVVFRKVAGSGVEHSSIIGPAYQDSIVFFLQPIWNSDKIDQEVYLALVEDLCSWAAQKEQKLILKLHPRMTRDDITALLDLGVIIDDTDQPGEMYHKAKLCISISSQVIWFGHNGNRVSLMNLLEFKSDEIKSKLRKHVLDNSDGNILFIDALAQLDSALLRGG